MFEETEGYTLTFSISDGKGTLYADNDKSGEKFTYTLTEEDAFPEIWAEADEGYAFVEWDKNGEFFTADPKVKPYEFGDDEYTAVFEPDENERYTVIYTAQEGGTVEPASQDAQV